MNNSLTFSNLPANDFGSITRFGTPQSFVTPTPTTVGDIALPQAGVPQTNVNANPVSGLSNQEFLEQRNQLNIDNLNTYNGRNNLGKTFRNIDGSFDFGAVGSAAQALGGIGQLYLGFQANKTARDSLNFQREAYQTNLANQIASYNTAITDRARSRAAQNNSGQAAADAYINENSI